MGADASPDFQDLISQLLDKNPATRLTWTAMCEHPFWQTPLPQRPMPPEPMLDAFIRRHGLRPAAQPVAIAPADGQLETHVRAAQVSQTSWSNPPVSLRSLSTKFSLLSLSPLLMASWRLMSDLLRRVKQVGPTLLAARAAL